MPCIVTNGTALASANIGNIKTHHIDVNQDAQVGNLMVKSGANIGGDAYVGRDISIGNDCIVLGRIKLGSVEIIAGTGTPESAITAPIGSTFHRDDGGASTSYYVKESGTGNTGWVAKL